MTRHCNKAGASKVRLVFLIVLCIVVLGSAISGYIILTRSRADSRFYAAAGLGDVPAVARFVDDQGFDVNSTRFADTPPMVVAAQFDRAEMIRYLASRGGDVNGRDIRGCTPLIMASINMQTNAVVTLLALGANPDLADKYGRTAMDYLKSGADAEFLAVFEEARGSEGSRRKRRFKSAESSE